MEPARTRNKQDNRKQVRHQKAFNQAILVVTLVIIVFVTVYALSRPTGVTLPSYLDHCVPLSAPLAYNSSFLLQIVVNGVNQTIPQRIGIIGNCVKPIHTFTAQGVVHIDTDQNGSYTLGDFFLIWGNTYGPDWATFNKDQLFLNRADDTHHVTLTVNQVPDNRFETYPLPTSGDSTKNPKLVISYG